jgi:hypothetical protein
MSEAPERTKDLNNLAFFMHNHNSRFPACNPLQCDTLDMYTKALASWVGGLSEPVRLQMVTMLLKVVTEVTREHLTEDWYGKYERQQQCS